jgi:V8-like Glu-specific endopeptidase
MERMAMSNHRFSAFLIIVMLFVPEVASQTLEQDPLRRLPVLSKIQEITDATSPDPLPTNDEVSSVSCFNAKKTIDAAVPWTWCYDHKKATKFVRLHIRVRGFSDDSSWYLSIKDESGRQIEQLTAASFRWNDGAPDIPATADRWTDRVPGQKVQIELHASSRPRDLKLVVDRLNVSFFQPGRKAITTGSNDMRDLLAAVTRTHVYYDYSRSIAIIRLMMSDGSGRETNCTGFLLTQDLLMTNQHCISKEWQLDTAKATFGYESQAPAALEQDTIPFDSIEMQCESLDFTILHLKWPARNNWRPAKIDTSPISQNQALLLIQHPNDQRKVLSAIECKVQSVSVLDRPQYVNDFYHLCDCAGGSSGSPIIDAATGRVVGLHHRELERPFDDGINLAVKIGPILEQIKKNDTLYQRIKATLN